MLLAITKTCYRFLCRSMFDSDLAQGAGSTEGSDSINRHVEADTPEATRLVFGGSDYGKDQHSLTRSEEKQAEIEALAARAGAGTSTSAAAPIHHDRLASEVHSCLVCCSFRKGVQES